MSLFGNFFGKKSQVPLSEATTVLEIVTNTAGLASNLRDIDPILDEVRLVTSSLKPGQTLSEEDDEQLIGAYLRLEEYLITREPIRSFTKEELRNRLSDAMRQRVETYEAKG
jgi:hypothetical protein